MLQVQRVLWKMNYNLKLLKNKNFFGETLNRVSVVIDYISKLKRENKIIVVAIDGRTGSGKTTISSFLSFVFDEDINSVVHMDDFFLPKELRTPERLNTAGGNVHSERFIEQVIPFLRDDIFRYRKFDCSIVDYSDFVEIKNNSVRIVEGSYSTHPIFGKYADITIFSDISFEEQKNRILKRNGEEKLKIFLEKWIPMEEAYFKAFDIKNKVDFVV